MGLLTFAINVTLDGCIDHREAIADEELHAFWTKLMDEADAMLWGRVTYEMMEAHWPAVARDESAPPATREWAIKLDAKPKYVVSKSRREYTWEHTHHLDSDLRAAVTKLKAETSGNILLGGHTMSGAVEALGLIDEYRFLVHPIIAGHGPTLFQGVTTSRQLELVSSSHLKSGAIAQHYRRRPV